MNQDFDRFEQLWQQEPADEEIRLFRKLAARAGRKGRALQYAEWGLALLLIAGALAVLFLEPAPATLIVVFLIVTGILWSSWKRSQLAQAAAMLDRSSREALIQSAEKSAKAQLKNSALGLVLIVPGWMLGIALKGMMLLDGNISDFLNAFLGSFTKPPGIASAAVVAAIFAILVQRHLRLRRELRRLVLLREQYRQEAVRDEENQL